MLRKDSQVHIEFYYSVFHPWARSPSPNIITDVNQNVVLPCFNWFEKIEFVDLIEKWHIEGGREMLWRRKEGKEGKEGGRKTLCVHLVYA